VSPGGREGIGRGERPGDERKDRPVLEFKPLRRSPGRPGEDVGPQAIADLLIPTLARLGLKTRARYVQILSAWPVVVGDMVAAHTTPTAFARGRLTVETDTPAMGHQLHLQRQTILEGLNEKLGDAGAIVDIRFRLAGDKDLSDGSRRRSAPRRASRSE
jgi:predicted nucleic acid-binding Zn ribbon protein